MAAPPAKVKVDKAVPPPLIGSFLLETITTGMYGERRNAIREYVQNSFDGIQSAIARGVLKPGKGKITLTVSGDNNLVIHDDGIGLPRRIAVNTLTAVGASRKERGRQAGFRGIGRLAGIAFSKELQFRTKSAGDEIETIVRFDCEGLRKGMLERGQTPAAELIASCATWDQPAVANPDDHYFEVSLIGLVDPPNEATNHVSLSSFLSQVAPVDFHPEFADLKKRIMAEVSELETEDGSDGDSLLERVPLENVSVWVRNSDPKSEHQVYKPYRPKMSPASGNKTMAISKVSAFGTKKAGAWWGWIGHKNNPGEFEETVGGIRLRLKNIQIDGSDLIRTVPVTNEIQSAFWRWSRWFVGEIHVDPSIVIPNARRDGFEEDENWLAIREDITPSCEKMTEEARKVSKDYQVSFERLEKRISKLREDYLKLTRQQKTFDVVKARKLAVDSDKVQKDIEKAIDGAASGLQLRLKSLSKELTEIRTGLLQKPRTADYEKFRRAVREEFLSTTLEILNDYLELQDYEEVKKALEKALR